MLVKGGGVCIYCGWDGGEKGLRDEHAVPYSLGGNTVLLGQAVRIARPSPAISTATWQTLSSAISAFTSTFSREAGTPQLCPRSSSLRRDKRAVDLATEDHPYFLNMPIWRRPGFMTGQQLADGFGASGKFTCWYVPPNLRGAIGLTESDVARIIDTSRPHNLSAFARGLAKIAYCNAVMKYGLDGFRPSPRPTLFAANIQTSPILSKQFNGTFAPQPTRRSELQHSDLRQPVRRRRRPGL